MVIIDKWYGREVKASSEIPYQRTIYARWYGKEVRASKKIPYQTAITVKWYGIIRKNFNCGLRLNATFQMRLEINSPVFL